MISPIHHQTLFYIIHHQNCRMIDIAQGFHLSPAAVTRTVDNLIVPSLVGKGQTGLFEALDLEKVQALELIEQKIHPGGVVHLRYSVKRNLDDKWNRILQKDEFIK